jgi:hypothetical protein
MPTTVLTYTAKSLDTLLAQVNGDFASLLAHRFTSCSFDARDVPYNKDYRLVVVVETGGTVITNPMVMVAFDGGSLQTSGSELQDYIAANPTYFISPPFVGNLTGNGGGGRINRNPMLIATNVNAAQGQQAWAAGGPAPTGVAGGDLSGSYPDPTVSHVAGVLPTATGLALLSVGSIAAGLFLAGPASGPAANPTFRAIQTTDIPALPYVSSVGLSLPGIFSVSGSPVTLSGTLTGTLQTQAANMVFAGPASGPDATPTFRALVPADVTVSLAPTLVGFGSATSTLTGSSDFVYVSDLATGGLSIGNTTPSISTATGSLKVAGGVGVSGAGFFGGEVTANAYRFNSDISIVGARAAAAGTLSIAVGGGSTIDRAPAANGIAAIAIGGSETGTTGARATGNGAIAIGGANGANNGANADGTASIAMGLRSRSGFNSVAIGQNTFAGSAIEGGAIAIGRNANAVGNGTVEGGSICVGQDSNSTGSQTVVVGYAATASGLWSMAIGRQALATGSQGNAIGAFAKAIYTGSVAIGNWAEATKANQMVFGRAGDITEVNIPATTASTNSTTGALVVAGGIGSSGNIYSAGSINNFGLPTTIPLTFAFGGGAPAPAFAAIRGYWSEAGAGNSAAIYGRNLHTTSNSGTAYGVVGYSQAGGGGAPIGVHGRALNLGNGVLSVGVDAVAYSTRAVAGTLTYGVRATSTDAASSNGSTVYGGSLTAVGSASSPKAVGLEVSASGAIDNSAIEAAGDVVLGAADAFYLGAKATDGTWRYVRSVSNLLFQRRASGSYVSQIVLGDETVITGATSLSSYLTQAGIAAPAVSPAGQGRIYFDSGLNVFRASQNGGAYVNLIGGGGGTPAGSNTELQFNNSGAFGASSNLTWNGSVLYVNGKLTVTGLIDPTGVAYTPVAANPGGALAASTFWVNSTGTVPTFGSNALAIDNSVVHLAGTETVTGSKTFSAVTTVSDTTAATSRSSAAFVVAGGAGFGNQTVIDSYNGASPSALPVFFSNAPLIMAGGGGGLTVQLEGFNNGPTIWSRASGGSRTAPSATLGGQILFQVQGAGWDGTGPIPTASATYAIKSQGAYTPSNNSAFHLFGGIPSSSITWAEWVRIQDANLRIMAGAIDVVQIAAPSVSDFGSGKIYFDSTSKKFRVSQDGGAYVDMIYGGAGTPAGSNTQLQFNNSGAFGASSNLTWDGSALYVNGKLTVTGLIDPTGVAYTPVAANPGGALAASTFWVNSTGTVPTFGSNALAIDNSVVHLAGIETVTGSKTFSAVTTVSNATVSTNTTNGALVVTGGAGIGGSLNVAGPLSCQGGLIRHNGGDGEVIAIPASGTNASWLIARSDLTNYSGIRKEDSVGAIQWIIGNVAGDGGINFYQGPSNTDRGGLTIGGVWSFRGEDAGATSAGQVRIGAGNVSAAGEITAAGITSRQAATQDAVRILGRAGGSSSRAVTLTTAILGSSRTQTLQDADGTIALLTDITGGVEEKTANFTAVNGHNYIVTTNGVDITDPPGVQAKGYSVIVRSGSGATINGVVYLPGQVVIRYYDIASWATYVYAMLQAPVNAFDGDVYVGSNVSGGGNRIRIGRRVSAGDISADIKLDGTGNGILDVQVEKLLVGYGTLRFNNVAGGFVVKGSALGVPAVDTVEIGLGRVHTAESVKSEGDVYIGENVASGVSKVRIGRHAGSTVRYDMSLDRDVGNGVVKFEVLRVSAGYGRLYFNPNAGRFTVRGDTPSAPADGETEIGLGDIRTDGRVTSKSATGGIGYETGAGGTVTQGTSRATAVTINKICGEITLFTGLGTVVPTSFTVNNSSMTSAADQPHVTVKSSTNTYLVFVTSKSVGSFQITFFTTGGIDSDTPVFSFDIIKAVNS